MARSLASARPPGPQLVTAGSALGEAVRAQRLSQRMRIDTAAGLSGVSVDVLSRLEQGKGSVRLDTLLRVLDGLGLALVLAPKADEVVRRVSRRRDTNVVDDDGGADSGAS